MPHSAYLVGRKQAALKPPYSTSDAVFAADRIDGTELADLTFQHCTFANVSFKKVVLQRVNFVNCIFIGCYFRRARICETNFKGCRFFDCDFPHVAISGSDFRYSTFHGCVVPYEEMEHSLPGEPNLRRDLARNLSLEAIEGGRAREARAYRRCEIRAREDHLWAALTGQSQWYRDHFDAWRRLGAFVQWVGSKANGFLWGYGEKVSALLRSYLLLGLIVFPLLFYLSADGLRFPQDLSQSTAILLFSLELIVPAGLESGTEAASGLTRMLAGVEAVLGVVFLGLLASYILRWSLRR